MEKNIPVEFGHSVEFSFPQNCLMEKNIPVEFDLLLVDEFNLGDFQAL